MSLRAIVRVMLTQEDLDSIKGIVRTEVQSETTPLHKDVKTIKKRLTKVEKLIETIISRFDKDYTVLRARVDNIEDHLNISTP